jgi:hypothetical protein
MRQMFAARGKLVSLSFAGAVVLAAISVMLAGPPLAFAVSYYLPWIKGKSFQCTQGNGGAYSHNDVYNWYAWDFGLGFGEPVRAAAAGTVIGVRRSSPDYDKSYQPNYVLVSHSDGTRTGYYHLKSDSVPSVIQVNAAVHQGQVVGGAGCSGNSDGVHLHFSRYNSSGASIALTFADVGVPIAGRSYTSGNTEDSGPSPQGSGVGKATFLGSSTLKNGQIMLRGQYLLSGNGLYALILQSDGNLVLYGSGYRALWNSGTAGKGATFLGMQGDGNLVLYTDAKKAVWASGTNGNTGCYASVQNDGNFVVRDSSGAARWNSKTGGHSSPSAAGSDRLKNGQTLKIGKYLQSGDKRFSLLLQSDGNLVLYEPGYRVVWSSKTAGKGATFLGMQSDGNLVLYTAAHKAVWSSKTAGNSGCWAVVQTDGNFVVYNAAKVAKWATGTAGKLGDKKPPVTTARGADGNWHNQAVTVTLAATDSGGAGLRGGSARTEYRLDGGSWKHGLTITLPAPADHAGDGVHTLSYRSVDAACNVESAKTVTVRIDTRGPVTKARSASGRRARALSLRYLVSDALSPTATSLRIVVRNARGKTVRTLRSANCRTGAWQAVKWTPKARGTYRYSVYAADLAGNVQASVGSGKVRVR